MEENLMVSGPGRRGAMRLIGGAFVGGLAVADRAVSQQAVKNGTTGDPSAKEGSPEPTLAVEDLMREHGVLRRALLVYEEASRRLSRNEQLPVQALREAAD